MITPFFNNGFNVLDKFKHMTVEEIKSHADADRLPFGVLCLNLEKDLNIANIIRSAHLFGADNVFTVGWNKVDSRGMVGVQHYTNLHKIRVESDNYNDVTKMIEDICESFNYVPVFIEYNENSKSINSFSFKRICNKRPMFIMGNEGKGIPESIMNYFHNKNIFHIEQRGVMRSLNVSSAASVVFHEAQKNITSKIWSKLW